MSTSSQARSLGPHVVGTRVVVRRVLPGETGPSGGPAMTDLLGTCVAWGDGVCVVSPDAGGPDVSIPLSEIVSGKPVPPRPSPRLRVSPRDAQVRAFALFPDLEVEEVAGSSGWVLRSSATATARRANSVLAFPSDGGSYGPDEVAAVEAHYAALGKPPVAAVLGTSEVRTFLEGLGWVPESHDEDTLFQIASVAAARRAVASVDTSGVVITLDGGIACAALPGAAQGFAAYADDWVGIRGIEVVPLQRRQGLARTVMAALLAWAAELGATTAYLQVLGDNDAALALYESMGFTTHHQYAYLTPLLNPGLIPGHTGPGGARRGAAPSPGSAPTGA